VQQVKDAGGELIVMPHSDGAVIRAARDAGLYSAPGVATVTEAFAALDNGADVLKMFPAEQLGPQVVKAWRAVISRDIALLPVGGITPEGMAVFRAAGASGFGLGSACTPGLSAVGAPARRRLRGGLEGAGLRAAGHSSLQPIAKRSFT
jgi:2-dehydro-3-deoxyphosphogalactonate aldolase